MATVEELVVVQAGELRRLATAVLAAAGMPEDDAALTATTLIEADLRGTHSHGLYLLERYVRRLRAGGTKGRPQMRILRETAATALLDGDDGQGQVVAARAMRLAIEKARTAGIGLVQARRSHHIGALYYWTMMALPHDMIGIAMTSGIPIMVPFGGIRPLTGNNPIAVAIPAGEERPIVFDAAMSVAAMGRIHVAERRGRSIPPGWALDQSGQPTTDPIAGGRGTVLPMGDHKGYGLALVVEALSGVLTGAVFAGSAAGRRDVALPQELGHTFQAIDVAAFMDPAEFKARTDSLIRQAHAVPRAPGVERIYVPGEPEFEIQAARERDGIPVDAVTLRELEALAREAGVPGLS
ncbi:MAG: Ldh family oxidoreductase [Chloroflexi bacterium]|nr:Ldh family oxidoreductase [Chloroflexota bacterium]